MKEIIFDTKQNNNKRREAEFLSLSPARRVEVFLKMCNNLSHFPQKEAHYKNQGNFVIYKKAVGADKVD